MTLLVLSVIIGLAAITISFWKFGFVEEAEHPIARLEKEITDPRAQKIVLKRLTKWREEGKLSREEFERFLSLCETEW